MGIYDNLGHYISSVNILLTYVFPKKNFVWKSGGDTNRLK